MSVNHVLLQTNKTLNYFHFSLMSNILVGMVGVGLLKKAIPKQVFIEMITSGFD